MLHDKKHCHAYSEVGHQSLAKVPPTIPVPDEMRGKPALSPETMSVVLIGIIRSIYPTNVP
jgi:hypothetical protein